MSLWDTVHSWWGQNAAQLVYARIPASRTDVPEGAPIAADRGYVRVWLADMFLTKSRAWFSDWHPCVQTSLRMKLADREEAAVTHVARPPEGAMSPGVWVGYPVTGLLPFSGGIVELEAALLALKGEAYLATALGILESFSALAGAPIAEAIAVAEKVATGLEKLVGAVDGKVHLGFHDAFGSAGGMSTLAPGYLAVVRASAREVDPASLWVQEKRLRVRDAKGRLAPFEGFDSMLFYIEGRAERDDFRLRGIQEPLDEAVEAIVLGDGPRADAYKKAALVAALTCKELTALDRRRVAQAIKDELEQAKGASRGAVGSGDAEDLDAIVRRRASSFDAACAVDDGSDFESELFG